jgi:divalent metal cation (Fe/Co/Zn/Cd) transporter
VVVGVRSDAGVGQGHAVANAVEDALHGALPGSDVVVHVEPRRSGTLRERVSAAALTIRGVREIHNLTMLEIDGRTELSLHLKLPHDMTLDQAHSIASETEAAIIAAVPEVSTVHTHIEPLKEPALGRAAASPGAELLERSVVELVRELTGSAPLQVRLRETDGGAMLFLTMAMDRGRSLAEAHTQATAIEERIRSREPAIADVVVHTEPEGGSWPGRA